MRRFIVRTADELEKFLKKFNTKVFAFDTETTSLLYTKLQLEGISLADGSISCYIYMADFKKDYKSKDYNKFIDIMKPVFTNANILIAHNAVYDLKVLYKHGIDFMDREPEVFDTMVAHHLLNETDRHGLKHLAHSVLNIDETVAYTDIDDHSSKEFFSYAINDAVWTWQLMTKFKPEIQEQELIKLFREIEMPFVWVLRDMEIEGMLVDVDKVRNTASKIKTETQMMLLDMCDMLHIKYEMDYDVDGDIIVMPYINFNSSKQLAELLFGTLGLEIVDTTPSGAPSVGKATIAKLRDSHPFVNILYKYKVAAKLYSSYFSEDAQILSNLESDGKVRPSFHDTGTATGRLSCSNPNLQQLPKVNKDFPIEAREPFIVPEGYTMITCDYSGQEVAVAAEVSRDPTLVDALNKGQDMHLRIANQFYNLGIPDEALFKTHPDYDNYKEKFNKERSQAKVITFGLMYGKSAYGFAKDFGISEEEAQEIVDKYFEGMPKLRESIERAHQSITDNGYVSTMTGRRRRFDKNSYDKYDNKAYRQAYNFLIQGFSADMMRMAMVAVRKIGKNNTRWGLTPIGTVHDEAIYQVRTEYVDVAKEAIKNAFESVVDFCVPVVGDVGVGSSYAEAK